MSRARKQDDRDFEGSMWQHMNKREYAQVNKNWLEVMEIFA